MWELKGKKGYEPTTSVTEVANHIGNRFEASCKAMPWKVSDVVEEWFRLGGDEADPMLDQLGTDSRPRL